MLKRFLITFFFAFFFGLRLLVFACDQIVETCFNNVILIVLQCCKEDDFFFCFKILSKYLSMISYGNYCKFHTFENLSYIWLNVVCLWGWVLKVLILVLDFENCILRPTILLHRRIRFLSHMFTHTTRFSTRNQLSEIACLKIYNLSKEKSIVKQLIWQIMHTSFSLNKLFVLATRPLLFIKEPLDKFILCSFGTQVFA